MAWESDREESAIACKSSTTVEVLFLSHTVGVYLGHSVGGGGVDGGYSYSWSESFSDWARVVFVGHTHQRTKKSGYERNNHK